MTSRRQHVRAMAFQDIKRAARELLITEGLQAVTVNAVARKLGMSGPAMYRYYASHEELIVAMTEDYYREVTAAIVEVRNSGKGSILEMSRAFRHWALRNPAEFRLIFGSPPLAWENGQESREDRQAAQAFGEVFFSETVSIWTKRPFPVPELASMDPKLADQILDYTQRTGGGLPPAAVYVFLQCWIRLYGHLCVEVLAQLDFAIKDGESLFEECLKELSVLLAIEYSRPG